MLPPSCSSESGESRYVSLRTFPGHSWEFQHTASNALHAASGLQSLSENLVMRWFVSIAASAAVVALRVGSREHHRRPAAADLLAFDREPQWRVARSGSIVMVSTGEVMNH